MKFLKFLSRKQKNIDQQKMEAFLLSGTASDLPYRLNEAEHLQKIVNQKALRRQHKGHSTHFAVVKVDETPAFFDHLRSEMPTLAVGTRFYSLFEVTKDQPAPHPFFRHWIASVIEVREKEGQKCLETLLLDSTRLNLNYNDKVYDRYLEIYHQVGHGHFWLYRGDSVSIAENNNTDPAAARPLQSQSSFYRCQILAFSLLNRISQNYPELFNELDAVTLSDKAALSAQDFEARSHKWKVLPHKEAFPGELNYNNIPTRLAAYYFANAESNGTNEFIREQRPDIAPMLISAKHTLDFDAYQKHHHGSTADDENPEKIRKRNAAIPYKRKKYVQKAVAEHHAGHALYWPLAPVGIRKPKNKRARLLKVLGVCVAVTLACALIVGASVASFGLAPALIAISVLATTLGVALTFAVLRLCFAKKIDGFLNPSHIAKKASFEVIKAGAEAIEIPSAQTLLHRFSAKTSSHDPVVPYQRDPQCLKSREVSRVGF